MKYNNINIRRQDRLLDEEKATDLLRRAEYGVLSMTNKEEPYGVPLNFVWDGATCLYIHCAPEGRKLRMLKDNPNVSFCVVGKVNLHPRQLTTAYESIVIQGQASIVESEEEKRNALQLFIEKLAPDYVDVGRKYIEKSFHRTSVLRIDVNEWSGKCKIIR